MCRFMIYKGSDEILLSKLILDPSHSILTQSYDSRLRLDIRRPINADGFGIGYYTDPKLGPEPCIFTSTTPAWNCINLHRIAAKTASPLLFAHVRATTEGSLSDENCHPFSHGSLMWMHNGGLGGWKYIKRRLGQRLADKWYLGVHGGTDSEWAFALFLDTLERMGYDPSSCPEEGFGPGVLRTAMLKTIEQINEFIAGIPERTINEENVDTRSLLNFALTDGHSVVCTRYVSSKSDEAASLFYSSGTSWRDKEKGKFQMDRRDKGADIVLVASEPLTFERDNWVIVPTNSILTIHKQTVMIHPIVDKYYNYNPYYNRSAKFAVEQGLVASTTIPPTPQNGTPLAPTPNPLDDPSKRAKILDTIFRNRSPARSPAPDSGSTIVSHPTPVLTSPSTNVPRSYSESSPSSNPDSQSQSQSSSRRVKKEQGNTKKKRRSLPQSEMAQPERNAEQAVGTVTPEERPSYGDPSKIAQFFPELNLPRRGGRATHD